MNGDESLRLVFSLLKGKKNRKLADMRSKRMTFGGNAMQKVSQALLKQNQETPLRLQEGGKYRAKVVDRIDDRKAVVNIQGSNQTVRFEGTFPKGNHITVEIAGRKDGVVTVREIESQPSPQETRSQDAVREALRQAKIERPSEGLLQAARQVERHMPVTKETIEHLQRFMSDERMPLDAKLHTVRAAAMKQVPITETNLRHIHESLHHHRMADTLNEARTKDAQVTDERVDRAIRQAVEQLKSNISQERGRLQTFRETIAFIRQGLERGMALEEGKARVQKEVLSHPELTAKEAKLLRKALKEADVLQDTGRRRLAQALEKLEIERIPVESSSVRGERGNLRETLQSIERALLQGTSFKDVKERIEREVLRHADLSGSQSTTLRKLLGEMTGTDSSARARLHQFLQQLIQETSSVGKRMEEQVTTLLQQAQKGKIDVASLLFQMGGSEKEASRIQALVKQALQLDQVAGERLMEALLKIERSSSYNIQVLLTTLQSAVQKEPNFSQVFTRIQEQLIPILQEQGQKEVVKQLPKIEALIHAGKELQAREQTFRLLEEITNITRSQNSVSATYAEDEQRFANIPFETKQLLETRITERLHKLAADFKTLQDQAVKQLQQIEQRIAQQQRPDARQLLESTIKQLDRAILRSDAMLFTDMKTEKQLLQASGQLAEAKKLLQQGQLQQAKQIVNQVRQMIEKVTFQPSEQKIKQFVLQEEQPIARHRSALTQTADRVVDYGRQITNEPSARLMFEFIRTLGLNRDSEVAQLLTHGTKGDGLHTSTQTVKDSLLQLLKDDAKTSPQANQTLSHLSGQQLLSKSEVGTNMQHLYFHVPLPFKEKLEDIEVYVQARENGEMLDWENCTLYFKLNTPKLGETGIVIQAKDRQLSITLKNDQEDFSAKMQPLVEKTVASISALGYQLHDIQYTTLTTETMNEENQEEETGALTPFYTEEGFDYKI